MRKLSLEMPPCTTWPKQVMYGLSPSKLSLLTILRSALWVSSWRTTTNLTTFMWVWLFTFNLIVITMKLFLYYCVFNSLRTLQDSVYVLARAIKDMMLNETITEAPKDCDDSGVIWETGKKLFHYLKTRAVDGKTGRVVTTPSLNTALLSGSTCCFCSSTLWWAARERVPSDALHTKQKKVFNCFTKLDFLTLSLFAAIYRPSMTREIGSTLNMTWLML